MTNLQQKLKAQTQIHHKNAEKTFKMAAKINRK